MRLPEDVALEVAYNLQALARINNIKQFKEIHLRAACRFVDQQLVDSTIQWLRYMVGDTYK